MRLSAPLYLFDQKDSSLKVVPLGSDPFSLSFHSWIHRLLPVLQRALAKRERRPEREGEQWRQLTGTPWRCARGVRQNRLGSEDGDAH